MNARLSLSIATLLLLGCKEEPSQIGKLCRHHIECGRGYACVRQSCLPDPDGKVRRDLAAMKKNAPEPADEDGASPNDVPPTPVDVPLYRVADETPLSPRAGKRVEIRVATRDLSDAQCVEIIRRERHRAAPDGQISVHIPRKRSKRKFDPLCVDNFDGKGVAVNDWVRRL